MKKVIVLVLLLSSNVGKSLIVDDTNEAIKVTSKDGYLFFSKCMFLDNKLSDCRILNPHHGLQKADFQKLQQQLTTKEKHTDNNNASMHKIKWGLISLAVLTALIVTRQMYKKGVLKVFGDGCCHQHDEVLSNTDQHAHKQHKQDLWHRISHYFPRIDLHAGKQFFFKDKQWVLPTFLAQIIAIVTSEQKIENSQDKKAIYEFLHTELLNITTDSEKNLQVFVRSITTIEFMIYETVRLKQADSH